MGRTGRYRAQKISRGKFPRLIFLVSEVNGYAVGCPLCIWNEQVKTVRLRSSVISHMDDDSSQLQLAFSGAQQNRIRYLLYTHHRNAAICTLVQSLTEPNSLPPIPEEPHCGAELPASTIDVKKLLRHLHAEATFCRVVC